MNVAYSVREKDTLEREVMSLDEGMKTLGLKEALLLVAEDREKIIELEGRRKVFIAPLWKCLL